MLANADVRWSPYRLVILKLEFILQNETAQDGFDGISSKKATGTSLTTETKVHVRRADTDEACDWIAVAAGSILAHSLVPETTFWLLRGVS